jgi:hypothetical protein
MRDGPDAMETPDGAGPKFAVSISNGSGSLGTIVGNGR